jgi:hypothetical protein
LSNSFNWSINNYAIIVHFERGIQSGKGMKKDLILFVGSHNLFRIKIVFIGMIKHIVYRTYWNYLK